MFEKVVCLSLDKRFAERVRISTEFAAHDMKVNFFTAGDGKTLPVEQYDRIDTVPPPSRYGYPAWVNRPNSYNAFQCFREIITKAKQEKVHTLLILEDDVTLSNQFYPVLTLASIQLQQYDPAWDMLYLGANHTFWPTKVINANLLKLNGSVCWHAVALKHTVFDRILALPSVAPIDEMCGKHIHPVSACYAVWPNIALTKPGFSYCEGTQVDYNHYFLNKGCNQ
jgi:GR25 family glycosyltransferase involved in LPS biosynthesis